MIYTLANTIEAGRPVDRVIDANGLSYDRGLLSVNTETGDVLRQVTDKDGVPLIRDNRVVVESVRLAPPLIVIFRKVNEV